MRFSCWFMFVLLNTTILLWEQKIICLNLCTLPTLLDAWYELPAPTKHTPIMDQGWWKRLTRALHIAISPALMHWHTFTWGALWASMCYFCQNWAYVDGSPKHESFLWVCVFVFVSLIIEEFMGRWWHYMKTNKLDKWHFSWLCYCYVNLNHLSSLSCLFTGVIGLLCPILPVRLVTSMIPSLPDHAQWAIIGKEVLWCTPPTILSSLFTWPKNPDCINTRKQESPAQVQGEKNPHWDLLPFPSLSFLAISWW